DVDADCGRGTGRRRHLAQNDVGRPARAGATESEIHAIVEHQHGRGAASLLRQRVRQVVVAEDGRGSRIRGGVDLREDAVRPSGALAISTASEIATVAPAEADRALPSTASVPDTAAERAMAPFTVAAQVQVNETVLFPARFCVAGVGPERICAPPVPDGIVSDGESPLTPTPPVSVTASVAVNVSPRRAPPGADSEATSADGVCTAIAGEPTDPADRAVPEFASAPVAPADRVSESGGAPPAVNVQEN